MGVGFFFDFFSLKRNHVSYFLLKQFWQRGKYLFTDFPNPPSRNEIPWGFNIVSICFWVNTINFWRFNRWSNFYQIVKCVGYPHIAFIFQIVIRWYCKLPIKMGLLLLSSSCVSPVWLNDNTNRTFSQA